MSNQAGVAIQTPEEFESTIWEMQVREGVESAIAARDTAIREDEREKHRLEVVADVKKMIPCGSDMSTAQCQLAGALQIVLHLPSLQPRKPPVHPRAVEVAKQIIPDDVPIDMTGNFHPEPCKTTYFTLKPTAERQAELAALLSSAVKPNGWKEQ